MKDVRPFLEDKSEALIGWLVVGSNCKILRLPRNCCFLNFPKSFGRCKFRLQRLKDKLADGLGAIVDRTMVWLCVLYGHVPMDDQCGFPYHMFCRWCRCPTPDLSTEKNIFLYLLDLDNQRYHRRGTH